jgi:rhamnose utilization protein RhaD (predicted bifunctional aldolase and dehydrogenase)
MAESYNSESVDISSIPDELAHFSQEFGKGTDYVLAGGGNSSWKANGIMQVKASGSRMATITKDDFVAMDLSALDAIWAKTYPSNTEEREAQALADLMAAKLPGQEHKRPSVESLLHSLFPEPLVMHTHPNLVNGLTCSARGPEIAEELFGDQVLWIPNIEPGYILAKTVRDAMAKLPNPVRIVFLENHGIFISGFDRQHIWDQYDWIFSELSQYLESQGYNDLPTHNLSVSPELQSAQKVILQVWNDLGLGNPQVLPFNHEVLLPYLKDSLHFLPLELSLTPDHIVYSGFKPLFVQSITMVYDQVKHYQSRYGELPKVIAFQNLGACALGATDNKAIDAKDLFLDGASIVTRAKWFGGPQGMPDELVTFIRNWEVEKYRAGK